MEDGLTRLQPMDACPVRSRGRVLGAGEPARPLERLGPRAEADELIARLSSAGRPPPPARPPSPAAASSPAPATRGVDPRHPARSDAVVAVAIGPGDSTQLLWTGR